jgi:NAD(P)-dependent dehydrogenase (short-subunit alcohol dehydrogenase family)
LSSPIDLEQTRVLLLGGSGVLGGEIGRQLHERGARLVLAGRDPQRLAGHSTSLGGAPVVQFDLRIPTDAERVVRETVTHLGGLDGLVNAAGVVSFGTLTETSDDALDALIATNLSGPLRVIRASLPHLEEGGFVVNLTGVVAREPMAGLAAYSATKAGLSAATTALGRELRRKRINVIDARPPHTETGLATRPLEGNAPRMPAGLDPGEVARIIVERLARGSRQIPTEDFS